MKDTRTRDVQEFFERVAGDWDQMRLSYYDGRVIEKMAGVGSTGERNGLCQCSSRGAVGESLAGSGVELQGDGIEVVLAVRREVALLGQVLPDTESA